MEIEENSKFIEFSEVHIIQNDNFDLELDFSDSSAVEFIAKDIKFEGKMGLKD
jgi:hypothetical protein